jgi:hypothetical protein
MTFKNAKKAKTFLFLKDKKAGILDFKRGTLTVLFFNKKILFW